MHTEPRLPDARSSTHLAPAPPSRSFSSRSVTVSSQSISRQRTMSVLRVLASYSHSPQYSILSSSTLNTSLTIVGMVHSMAHVRVTSSIARSTTVSSPNCRWIT